jgi:hypothetical protein
MQQPHHDPYGGSPHGRQPNPQSYRQSYNTAPYQYNYQHAARMQEAPSPLPEPAAKRARYSPEPPQQQGKKPKKERTGKKDRGSREHKKQQQQQGPQVSEAEVRYQQLSDDIAQLVSEVRPEAASPPAFPAAAAAAPGPPHAHSAASKGRRQAAARGHLPLGLARAGDGCYGLLLADRRCWPTAAAQVAPDAQEQAQRDAVLQQVSAAARAALYHSYPRAQVHQFGSGACGMSTHASDLDVVVTGAISPSLHTGGRAGGRAGAADVRRVGRCRPPVCIVAAATCAVPA